MPSVSFVSLGCPKNLVDSEKMLGLITEAGCPLVAEDAGDADVMVVNTCGFLQASRDEALAVIQDAAARKRAGRIKRLVVVGCLAQRDGPSLIDQVPEIDALLGVNSRRDVVLAVTGGEPVPATPTRAKRKQSTRTTLNRQTQRHVSLGEYHAESWVGPNRSDRARLRLTPAHYAYLRISEGCDQKCTFCTIPSIRGPMHSKPADEILAEAAELVADGAVELILIGQDTTGYGRDIGYEPGLPGLLRELNGLDGVAWLRLMYAYPSNFTDAMIDAIAECDRLVKYVDLPLQHINDRVLKAMYRRVTRGQTEALLTKLRDRVAGVAIRTTIIVGFPDETDEAFEELLGFIRAFKFDALGAFAYSNEPGTPAYRMKGQLPKQVIEERVEQLMLTQQEIAFTAAASRVGDVFRVLIDDVQEPGVHRARHAGQAPEVDSVVLLHGDKHDPGQFTTVECTGSQDYDLLAKPAPARTSR